MSKPHSSTRTLGLIVAVFWAATVWLSGCSEDTPTTAVRLAVRYEADWSLTQLEVRAAGRVLAVDARHEVLLLLPAALSGGRSRITVAGLRGGERYASGFVDVEVTRGVEARAEVVLARVACGAWCVPGAMACRGDGVSVCEQRDEDGCFEWSDAIDCPPSAPQCSFGQCASTCTDECLLGERRCAGPSVVEVCDDGDSDPCSDWVEQSTCGAGESCSAAECRSGCVDECDLDAVECVEGGTRGCADRNRDGCSEWGPIASCADDQVCSDGVCTTRQDAGTDAGTATDTGMATDTGTRFDAGPDSGFDAGPDSGFDAGRDAGFDAGRDSGFDAGRDSGLDAGRDSGFDAGRDSGFDAGRDAGLDAGPPPELRIEVVDADEVGPYTSLALTAMGRPIVAYYAEGRGALKLARWTGAGWVTEVVDSADNSGPYADLALDSRGDPHVAYAHFYMSGVVTLVDLSYARWSGSAWSIETVVSNYQVGTYGSLALDSADLPRIAYHHILSFDSASRDLKYAENDGTGWDGSTVASAGDVGTFTSLALDAAGHPHIAYRDDSMGALGYARWTGTRWNIELVDSAAQSGQCASLVLDSEGRAHISYRGRSGGTPNALKHAHWSGSSWTVTTVDPSADVGYTTSIALDEAGRPGIAYYESGAADLRLARWTPAGWSLLTIDATGDVGVAPSLAIDSLGNAHLSYQDYDRSELKYAFVPRGWAGAP